jgi:hypothetical protein
VAFVDDDEDGLFADGVPDRSSFVRAQSDDFLSEQDVHDAWSRYATAQRESDARDETRRRAGGERFRDPLSSDQSVGRDALVEDSGLSAWMVPDSEDVEYVEPDDEESLQDERVRARRGRPPASDGRPGQIKDVPRSVIDYAKRVVGEDANQTDAVVAAVVSSSGEPLSSFPDITDKQADLARALMGPGTAHASVSDRLSDVVARLNGVDATASRLEDRLSEIEIVCAYLLASRLGFELHSASSPHALVFDDLSVMGVLERVREDASSVEHLYRRRASMNYLDNR